MGVPIRGCPTWCSGMCDFRSRDCALNSRRLQSHTSFSSGGYGVVCEWEKEKRTKTEK